MILLCDTVQVEARVSPFGDNVNLDTRLVHDLHQTCNRLVYHFGVHLMEPLGDVGQVEARFLSVWRLC
jgi:hypothetical protein